jgi:outer membrane protein assembly factor BamD
MKYLKFLIFLPLLFYGCSSTIDTQNLGAQERFKYAMDLYNSGDYLESIDEFEAIILQFPGNDIVDNAQFYLANARFNRKEYILGASEFSRLIKGMPASPFVPDAQYMLAECYYMLSPYYALDQRYTKKAIEEFQSFIDFFPTDKRVEEAEKKIAEMNDKLAQKTFHSAQIYERMGYYNAAAFYYNIVLEVYHDTQFAPKASYNRIQALLEKGRIADAEKEVDNFLEKFPNDENYDEVQQLKESLKANSNTTVN